MKVCSDGRQITFTVAEPLNPNHQNMLISYAMKNTVDIASTVGQQMFIVEMRINSHLYHMPFVASQHVK